MLSKMFPFIYKIKAIGLSLISHRGSECCHCYVIIVSISCQLDTKLEPVRYLNWKIASITHFLSCQLMYESPDGQLPLCGGCLQPCEKTTEQAIESKQFPQIFCCSSCLEFNSYHGFPKGWIINQIKPSFFPTCFWPECFIISAENKLIVC